MSTGEPADPGREAIVAALERHRVEYVVIGGAAAQARGWPEPTDDIDFTPERSEGNLSRLAAAVAELDAGFRVDPARYPEGYRPPDGIDWRTFRNQISIAFATRHGNFDVVLLPDGTKGYEDHRHGDSRDASRHCNRRARGLGRDDSALQGRGRSSQGPRRPGSHARSAWTRGLTRAGMRSVRGKCPSASR